MNFRILTRGAIPQGRKKVSDWEEAQDVFYAWVRKAYKKSLGEDVDVPKLIKSQMSGRLKTALQQVKVDYGKTFQYGGFNPRPIKLDGYGLGTISEHGIGTAINVESGKNAHIQTRAWQNILLFTGKSLNQATRISKWKSAPKELYDGIKEINDEFVAKLAETTKDTEDAAKKSAQAAGVSEQEKIKAKAVLANPFSVFVEQSDPLKIIGLSFVKEEMAERVLRFALGSGQGVS